MVEADNPKDPVGNSPIWLGGGKKMWSEVAGMAEGLFR